MKKVFTWAIGSLLLLACNDQKPAEPVVEKPAADAKPAPAEFADPKYIAIGQKGMDALAAGDVDTWMSGFADNAVYLWNSGDSLAGKAAITDYWKKRRTTVIDSLKFDSNIWLPIKVNQPQSVEQSGVWLLSWYRTTAKYKTGKSMIQWMHMDLHFDANDKIDRVIHYIDRSMVNAATTK